MFQNVQERIASRRYSFPENLKGKIETELSKVGYSLERPGDLAKAIKRLSDFYLESPQGQTPWSQKWVQAAYLAYFFPLNFARSNAVFDEGSRVGFFEGLENFIDFGSGLSGYGFLINSMKGQFIDVAPEPLKIHRDLMEEGHNVWSQTPAPITNPQTGLGIFSYVLTELKELPAWALELEALLIVEPSTRDDGRRLQALRKDLLTRGYFAWAPCTHQEACPLLEKSKHDWCHDRIFFEAPQWFSNLEKLLPMKNRTVTFSYLLVRKTRPFVRVSENAVTARLVGDRLNEKGKTRQLVCRGPEREFLSWLHKEGVPPELFRGQTVSFEKSVLKKGDELRVRQVQRPAE
jgi:hypothetical protein